jgi:hypothetical protein
MVAEKVCCISRKKTHDSTFFVNVLTKRDNALGRVDHRSISLSGGGARLKVEVEVAVSINAG